MAFRKGLTVSGPVRFTNEQVLALCGGKWPEADGFDYPYHADYWQLEEGILQPYDSLGDLLPAPGVVVATVPEPSLHLWLDGDDG